MDSVECLLDINYGDYFYKNPSSIEMVLLARFLCSDVWPNDTVYRHWALTSTDGDAVGGNCTVLENEHGFIVLSDEYPVIPNPTTLKMTIKQFVQLCDDWQNKVMKKKPKQVIIKYEYGEFFIETSD